jgi:hypothetical protein
VVDGSRAAMNDLEIRALVGQLDVSSVDTEQRAWAQLRSLGEQVVPYLEEAFPTTKQWQGRLSLVFHSIPFARDSEAAVRLGITALGDRSFMVRWRACGLLAYSQRRDALPALRALFTHADARTVEDAKAAVAAIESKNHHLFVDRQRTGRVFWDVRQSEP